MVIRLIVYPRVSSGISYDGIPAEFYGMFPPELSYGIP